MSTLSYALYILAAVLFIVVGPVAGQWWLGILLAALFVTAGLFLARRKRRMSAA